MPATTRRPRARARLALFAALIAPTLLAAARPAAADPLLSAFVGSGSQTSYLVLDFVGVAPGPVQSYAFGYRYDGTRTTGQFIDALVGANVGFTAELGGQVTDPFGRFVRSLGYNGFSLAVPSDFSSYWWLKLSSDGAQTWQDSQVGIDQRTLAAGSYDGFIWAQGGNTDPNPRVPQATAAVPEPASAGLLALGVATGAVLVRRRKRV